MHTKSLHLTNLEAAERELYAKHWQWWTKIFFKIIFGRNGDVSHWVTSRAAPLDHAPGLIMIALFAAVWSGVLVTIGMIAVVHKLTRSKTIRDDKIVRRWSQFYDRLSVVATPVLASYICCIAT